MKTRLEYQSYVDALASRMKLGHWEIEVLDEAPENEGALASITPWHGRHAAFVRLADNFPAGDAKQQRYVIVHELVHCYFAHAETLVRDDLSRDTGVAYRLATEFGVDAVASVIAGFMPLPSEVIG